MTYPAEYGGEFYLNRPPWDQPKHSHDAVKFRRVLHLLTDDEVAFLRDAFCEVGEADEPDFEAFDLADLCHDEIEIRLYGRVVTDRTE